MILEQTSFHFLPTSPTTLSVHIYHYSRFALLCMLLSLLALSRAVLQETVSCNFPVFYFLIPSFLSWSLWAASVYYSLLSSHFYGLRRHGYAFPPRIRSSLSASFEFCFSSMSIILLVAVFMRCYTFRRLSPCPGLGMLGGKTIGIGGVSSVDRKWKVIGS
jgi:hypothetical protein